MKPTKEEMLKFLSDVEFLTQRYAHNVPKDDTMFQAIRALIVNKPKVSKEFVKKWAESFYYISKENYNTTEYERRLFDLIHETGVEVEE
jgi:hypothetical protein